MYLKKKLCLWSLQAEAWVGKNGDLVEKKTREDFTTLFLGKYSWLHISYKFSFSRVQML